MSKFSVFYDDVGRLKRVDTFRYESSANAFQFYNSSRSHYIAIKANDSATVDTTYTWPQAPVPGAFLRTDANGNLSFEYNFITKNEFDFNVGVGGQSIFDTGVVLSGKYVAVFVNGVLARQGLSYDYRSAWPDATKVQFNYTLPQNAWVRVIVEQGAYPNEQEMIATGSNDSWFPNPTLGDLRGKYVQVYQNGVLLRQGLSYDYYIESNDGMYLLFTTPPTAGAWLKLVVY